MSAAEKRNAAAAAGPVVDGPAKDPMAAELGRRGGRKGGRARALSLTPEERREIARRAAAARWQRLAADAGGELEPARLPGTPVAEARGTVDLAGHRFDGFLLEGGQALLGLLSVEAALGHTIETVPREADVVTFQVRGDWRLVRGLPVPAFVMLCRSLIDRAIVVDRDAPAVAAALRALDLLADRAGAALEQRIAAAAAPLGDDAQRG
ncbi:MAG TPA: hypothetical protein VFG43_02485 [Geminicoccaceae bacterium]|nr:hypothetical protein [Geminicoccaceae bacterium]